MPTSRVDFSMYHDVAIFETTVYSRSLVIVTYVCATPIDSGAMVHACLCPLTVGWRCTRMSHSAHVLTDVTCSGGVVGGRSALRRTTVTGLTAGTTSSTRGATPTAASARSRCSDRRSFCCSSSSATSSSSSPGNDCPLTPLNCSADRWRYTVSY